MAAWFLITSCSLLVALCIFSSISSLQSLSTVSISETSNQTLVCALVPSLDGKTSLNCTSFPQGIRIPVNLNVSFSDIVAGNGFLCALRSQSSSVSIMVCYRFSTNGTNMQFKRVYRGAALKELDGGNSHICGLLDGTNRLECWQWPNFKPNLVQNVTSIAVGENFVCGLAENGRVRCEGNDSRVIDQVPQGNYSLVAAGSYHACALSTSNGLDCWGETSGVKPRGEFESLALGENRSCALRLNRTVVCWGKNNFALPQRLQDMRFIAIDAKRRVFCGVAFSNYSLICWGNGQFESNPLVFHEVSPGPCRTSCPCGALVASEKFCVEGEICRNCRSVAGRGNPPVSGTPPSPSLPPPPPRKGRNWDAKMVAFLVIGCVGSASMLSIAFYFLFKYCKGKGCRVHDSGRLDEEGNQPQNPQSQRSQRVLEKKLSHLISLGSGGHLEEFPLEQLLQATDNFSDDHKIGAGSFGSVYHAVLEDRREVAIKRAETSTASSYAAGTKRQEDKGKAFLNELESLSRLHHKHLVRLLGFCEDSNELILVYEFMNNGTLHDHLHKVQSSPLMSWAARFKVALDAARGIEYLHVYAVPPIIHRDIKSSNILLDADYTAKVSDFGLSLMGPKDEETFLSQRPAGTLGYMDPEYYRLQQLTTKSDVYSFGVILLELLTGYKAIHKNENGVPRNVVDFVVPYIVQDEIHRVLDPKVPPPTPFEIEAVAYVGYLAADCVNQQGIDRPTMSNIVNSLEEALAACLAPPTLSRSTTASSM